VSAGDAQCDHWLMEEADAASSPCSSPRMGFAPGWEQCWLLRAALTAPAVVSLQVHREESLPGARGSQAVRNRTRPQAEQDEALMCRGWPRGTLLPPVPERWRGLPATAGPAGTETVLYPGLGL